MPTLTIDGKEVTVEKGSNLIQAARRLGIEIPHYCYHPGLSVVGSCRMCQVEVEKAPKLQIACFTAAADGMVVHTKSEKVIKARQAVLEFLLINHPLDCPVCDQAGECWLQIYYMQHGLYESRFQENKVKKRKAIPIGPHVILDSERCVLCSRCVRFCDEVPKTSEIGIFNRGDHSEIALFPGVELKNNYSGNVVDICPVGALTDRDFRFQVRVWYLESAKSVCPGCSRGCNIEIHYNSRRPHHAEGRRVVRLKPRYNAEVNKWWMCDEGRYGYKSIDDNRILNPSEKNGQGIVEAGWDELIGKVASRLKLFAADKIGVLASPKLTNEDLFSIKKVFVDGLGVKNIDFRLPSKEEGYHDDFLITSDKNPNGRGANEIGLLPRDGGLDAKGMIEAASDGRLKALYVFGHDLFGSAWDEALVKKALSNVELLIFQGTNLNGTSEMAHFVLPSAVYAEVDGTFTNFQGRLQRIRQAVPPLGESLPTWEIVGKLSASLGLSYPYKRPEEIFGALSREVAGFGGLTYGMIGDGGMMLSVESELAKR
jgi:NADH-quinone oxidoreductase subunit G